MTTYSTPECHSIEIYLEGILCASDTMNGLLNEEWQRDDDYTIFNK